MTRDLRERLLRLFNEPVGERMLDDQAFDALAREVFAYQLAHNIPLAAFCARRGVDADNIAHWTEIPAVPTGAFREVALVAGDPADCDVVFQTSGTSRGAQRRGRHYVPDLSIYRAAVLAGFQALVLPDQKDTDPAGASSGGTAADAHERMPIVSIIPPASELVDSSLAHMVHFVIERFGGDGSGWFTRVEDGIDHEGLGRALRRIESEDRPACLLGTSFSFVHWLDRLDQHGERFDLPEGSRLMDTGGYKGRTREIPAPTMRERYARRLGLDPAYCVNEYGMTELCSQYYDASLSERVARAGDEPGTARQAAAGDGAPRRKVAPPWMRTRVVDPETLAPVVPGARGLLQHFDLANLGSVVAVQTEDVGYAVDDGIVVEGRAPAAPPRGCSIALDMLLDATRAHQAGLAAHQTAHPLTPPGAEVDP